MASKNSDLIAELLAEDFLEFLEKKLSDMAISSFITKIEKIDKKEFKNIISKKFSNDIFKVLIIQGSSFNKMLDSKNNDDNFSNAKKNLSIGDNSILIIGIDKYDDINMASLSIISATEISNEVMEILKEPIILSR